MHDKKYIEAIKNNFPNTNKDEVTSAENGRELREMLREEQRIIKFPNKKEVQFILANTAKEALKNIEFKLFKSFNQLKSKTKEYEDVIGFYYVRGNIDPTYSTRFLWLEKLTKKWIKENNLNFDQAIQFSIYSPCRRYFNEQFISFKSYFELSERYLQRLKLIDEILIPKHENLKDIGKLNSFLNYSDNEFDSFNGLRRTYKEDGRIILPNPIVAVMANDKNADKIFEAEVVQHIESEQIRKQYIMAFENLRKEYGA